MSSTLMSPFFVRKNMLLKEKKHVFSTKNGLIRVGLMSMKQLNKERPPLAFISVVGEGSSKLVGTKANWVFLSFIGNFSKYLCDKVFHSNFCQNYSGVPFSLFYQFRHPCIYSSSFPESMQKVKISAISVCPLMCVMLPLPCNRQGHGRV